jgi:Protein-disulfide isomerase
MQMKLMAIVLSLVLSQALAPAMAGATDKEALKQALAGVFPVDMVPDSIEPAPIPGLYEVIFGPQLFYVSADGHYLFRGHIFDLKLRQDVTEPRQALARIKAIERVGEENMIVFAPKEVKHTVTIFTDIDCPYCRKLHQEIDGYTRLGIKVRYLLFPRTGVGSPSYDKAVSVWCADNRQDAITLAKAGKKVTEKKCDNLVEQQMALGQLVGVTGTPAIVMANGRILPGYIPPRELVKFLDGQ